MAESKTALAVIEDISLPALNSDLGALVAEEMDGLSIEFDRVKIPSGGGLAFEVPGEDGSDMAKEIVGIIVDHHPVNAYWAEKFAGQNNPPDCSALDGKTGVTRSGERRPCNSCPHNDWGSDSDGVGKACKNMHRVYILRNEELFPLLLTLPPTSLKNFANYLAKRIVAKGKRSYEVLSKVALQKATSRTGITYSQAVFNLVGILSPDKTKQMAEYTKSIKPITRRLAVTAEEYTNGENYAAEEDVI
jgi:hypothetical protein